MTNIITTDSTIIRVRSRHPVVEHARAAHSKHSHIKAIIISPPAIITTFDNPLLAKLIFPSFQMVDLAPSFRSLPAAFTTLAKAFLWLPLSKAPYSPNICFPGAVHGRSLLCVYPSPDGLYFSLAALC
ncbi:unnamed protein product [Pleuronectes platessa]|uniref:Uncharacterized protein n=1 Tax=Pleuronectes platessa TaxID=8262 RepID=A0A9N7VSD7_PLEPL|nr:unnamed protein product [Pleuronectes platessa]